MTWWVERAVPRPTPFSGGHSRLRVPIHRLAHEKPVGCVRWSWRIPFRSAAAIAEEVASAKAGGVLYNCCVASLAASTNAAATSAWLIHPG